MRVAIIGAGPAGIAAGHELLKQGFQNFTIFDALDAPGGTWRQHSYPGLACDVWAHYYTFSYAPNPDWSANFVGFAEIQKYLADCATRFGLDSHMQLNTFIRRAEYQSGGGWKLSSNHRDEGEFDVVINAMGNQHTPLFPEVEGIADFKGASWHSTEWNHGVDLAGKRVVVVGSAAAAVQIVPEIAKVVGHLTVLQRSANWIMPRNRKPYTEAQRRRNHRFPWVMRLTRWFQSVLMGQVLNAVTLGHSRMGQFEKLVKKHIDDTVEDPKLREALVPDSRYGCRRGLVSDDFYSCLNADNVELIPQALQRVTTTGVVTSSGQEVEADVIIYCTGYKILDYDRFEVVGKGGISLENFMGDTPRAYKGICVPGFPNYFFAVGPNGLVLNVSYFTTMECNVASIVQLLKEAEAAGGRSLEVKKEDFQSYNDWMSGRFAKYSWGAADCNSYYSNASGGAPFLFPGSFKEFEKSHGEIGLENFQAPD
jgi:cation diffusion facilitator CzcD-associated flavoprotein CzcO